MPCHVDMPDPTTEEINRDGGMTLYQIEAVLCGVLAAGRIAILDSVDWGEVGVPRDLVERWWRRHQAMDGARRYLADQARHRKEVAEREELARLKAKYEGGVR